MDIPLGLDFPMDTETSAETAETAADTPSDAEDPEVQKKYRMMLSMWLSLCIIGFVWFVTKVLKGRQRIKCNFSSIEEQLKRMQAVIEERERAMAENANADGVQESGNVSTISADARDLPENSTTALGQTEREDNAGEETDLNRNELATEAAISEGDSHEPHANVDGASASRRRKFIDDPLDADNVELLRDTIEDIIQAGVQEVGAQSGKKDD